MKCVTMTSTFVLVNGSASDEFNLKKKSLWQGDPLSLCVGS